MKPASSVNYPEKNARIVNSNRCERLRTAACDPKNSQKTDGTGQTGLETVEKKRIWMEASHPIVVVSRKTLKIKKIGDADQVLETGTLRSEG